MVLFNSRAARPGEADGVDYHFRSREQIESLSHKERFVVVDVRGDLHGLDVQELSASLAKGENIYIRGFGSFITKKRAAKIGRNIKKNVAVQIPEHYIPAFKPAKEFVQDIKGRSGKVESTPE